MLRPLTTGEPDFMPMSLGSTVSVPSAESIVAATFSVRRRNAKETFRHDLRTRLVISHVSVAVDRCQCQPLARQLR